MENRYKFNDGTELENKEFSDGSGIELYGTKFRKYDPQIGRFHQVDELAVLDFNTSSYTFANNNPILLNDPLGLLSDSVNRHVLPTHVFTHMVPKKLDAANGQVLASRSQIWDLLNGQRSWQGHVKDGDKWRSINYAVDHNGYLTGRPAITNLSLINSPDKNPVVTIRQLINLKNFIKGQYVIYRGMKNGLPYIGKARGGINFRYSTAEQANLGVDVMRGLDNVPNNAVALGVEQLVIDLNGGVGTGKLANINNATVKEIYINEARYWLDNNIPNWERVLKFQ